MEFFILKLLTQLIILGGCNNQSVVHQSISLLLYSSDSQTSMPEITFRTDTWPHSQSFNSVVHRWIQEFAFLTSFQVTSMLLVWGPHFRNQCTTAFLSVVPPIYTFNFFLLKNRFYLLILERERKEEREILICCSTYLCIHC